MICNRCNHKLPDDSEFCQYCGNKIEKRNLVSAENVSIVQEDSINPSNNEKESRKQKVAKTRYCSFCGMLIDSESKKCTGCGKQYFNGIKINKLFVIILLAILLMSSVVLNTVQLMTGNQVKQELDVALGKNNKLLNEIANLESKVKSKESEVSRLAKQVASQKELVDFIDDYVVFEENDGTNRYHKFDCKKFKKSKFYVYNLSQADTWGTYPCSSCH